MGHEMQLQIASTLGIDRQSKETFLPSEETCEGSLSLLSRYADYTSTSSSLFISPQKHKFFWSPSNQLFQLPTGNVPKLSEWEA